MLNKVLTWVGVAAIAVLIFFAGRYSCRNAPNPVERVDTLVVHRIDTIVVEKPVYVAKKVVDTLLVPVRDTIRLRDTVYMAVEIEQKAYRDSLYEAWVSGYRPSLDSIRIYAPVKTVEIERTVVERELRRWGVGITAGYGATVQDGKVALSPYIGIGVTYNIFGW